MNRTILALVASLILPLAACELDTDDEQAQADEAPGPDEVTAVVIPITQNGPGASCSTSATITKVSTSTGIKFQGTCSIHCTSGGTMRITGDMFERVRPNNTSVNIGANAGPGPGTVSSRARLGGAGHYFVRCDSSFGGKTQTASMYADCDSGGCVRTAF